MNNEWITDRLPTEEDVDINDCVYNELGVYTHWQDIEKGRAWMPIIPPQPYVSVAVSETKHTPGPWEVSWDKYGKESEIHGKSELNDGPICIIPHDDVTESGAEEQLANARLIAAAPELLEALQMILDEDMEDSKRAAYLGGFVLPDDLRQQARAAIAKAKGEQP